MPATLGGMTSEVPIIPGETTSATPGPSPWPPAQARPHRRWWTVAVISSPILAVAIVGAAWIFDRGTPAGHSVPTSSVTATQTQAPLPPPVVPAEIWATPGPKDIVLLVKILKQECFGSAGCNVTYRIDFAYVGQPIEPGKTWDVTYRVTGGDDPQINTLQLTRSETGYTASVDSEEFIQTPSSKSKLRAAVTDVSEH